MKRFVSIFLILSVSLLSCTKTDYQKISKEEYTNKMKAAWIGQMIGVGWTAPTEFKFIGEIIPEEKIPEFDGKDVNAFGQDDIYVEMTFLKTLDEYGIDCSIRQAGIDFGNSEYMLWGANEIARENMRSGIAPPECSHPEYHKGADWIDYQIEADFAGIICPGMPNSVVALGEKFGRLMNYGDGLYGGQFMGGMYAAAYFESDIHKIIEAGLACIPEESQYAECVRDIVKWHRQDPNNWQKTWQLVEDRYRNNPEYQKYQAKNKGYWPEMDAKLNGAYIVIGLLYGEGDPDQTILITMRCGRDSDCNPSSAAGVLFASKGLDGMDNKYYEKLDYETKFSYTDYNFESLAKVCTKLSEDFILKEGGKVVKEADGKTYYYIPKKEVTPSEFVQSWEPGEFDKDNKFSDDEMAQINYRSGYDYEPLLNNWIPDYWKIFFPAKSETELITSWKGKDGVIVTPIKNDGRGVMVFLNNAPLEENKNHFLTFSVACEEGGSWDLIVDITGKKTIKETISNETCVNGWKDFRIDLSESAGEQQSIYIYQNYNGNEKSTAYWYKLKLEKE